MANHGTGRTADPALAGRRHAMVADQLVSRGITQPDLLEIMGSIPRELFVPPGKVYEAYADHPVPIGHGQTISQPLITAMMVQALDVHPGCRVLDVGAGSGYQTAVLAAMVEHVYAIERIADLAERAAGLLESLGVTNVTFHIGDGSLGWLDEAPFDRIICGAAGPDLPAAWPEQLVDGGKIVMPIGWPDHQELTVITKCQGQTTRRVLCDVRFVKLIGKNAWPS